MKILIAMDSFKGNLSSLDVAGIVEKGIKKVYSHAIVDKVAVADGGEGTVGAVVSSLGGRIIKLNVEDPLGKTVEARYGIVEQRTAVIEMAEASGLQLVPAEKRNPLVASSFGTGQLIKDAVEKGCRKIILGIGGSATNDGGFGLSKALGVNFAYNNKEGVPRGGGDLDSIAQIDLSCVDTRMNETEIFVACDVSNPLVGDNGASKVYGPQKGATEEMIRKLDLNLKHYAKIILEYTGKEIAGIPGTGAAGGIGASLIAFFGAKLIKGVDLVLDTVKLEERISKADVVITGEGRMDAQTAFGKVPVGVASRAKKYGKPVFAIAGFLDKGYEAVYEHGIDAAVSSMVGPLTLKEAIKDSEKLIEQAAERLFKIIKAVSPK